MLLVSGEVMDEQMRSDKLEVEVHVLERHVYKFPNPEARCSAHGQSLCIKCARNGPCGQCDTYEATGMHWDTCANRIR